MLGAAGGCLATAQWWPPPAGKLSNYCAAQATGAADSRDAAATAIKIRVDNLRRLASNGATLLSGINLEIKAGTIHGLIGPSGSGKSTVLRALNRLWEPPARAIFLDGADITQLEVIGLRRRVGMVFQAACLFPGKIVTFLFFSPIIPFIFLLFGFVGSVADNVRYGPLLRGVHLSDERIEELLVRAGIADPSKRFASKSEKELSGGEAQRVSLARTLANEPEVLLLDEPTSALDPLSTNLVEKTVMELRRDGMTVVLVSHNMQQIERIVDVATFLCDGSVVDTGTLEQLKQLRVPVLQQFFSISSI
ncbi:ABC transporter I family member 17 isoform X2 [Selaginella moellendorffii]|uniref:ABC transporter I family member 17 isoform X2 n=1 Tax=Selaginella moellendorffii TaxID=88036 RepID=UPI000D1CB41E|nr:ABC transporter I family member 17 isoform X2 [Selaginella moellendorffii]|eukprot:XP_024535032.1 ABC transporter I family member 17 isoform X2 [Selaginella moellendorffii]